MVISNSFSIKDKFIIALEFIAFIDVALKLLNFILIIVVSFICYCASLYKQQ